jgi:hypothetical protein
MDTVEQFSRHVIANLKEYASLAGVLLTILGAASSLGANVLGEWLSRISLREHTVLGQQVGADASSAGRQRTADSASDGRSVAYDSAPVIAKKTAAQVARDQILVRLNEVTLAVRAQEGTAKAARISNILLTVGQYVIGGVLASSFVQESLSPKWVGLLGVLVLIASLVKQQFHPELNAEDARKKASQLKALIRTSEDQLAILDAKMASGKDHSDALIALLTQITRRLNEIEYPEALESKP